MKQLLQLYKEVSAKAEDTWKDYVPDGYTNSGDKIDKSFLAKHQLKKLEIEQALYGYWERNVRTSIVNVDFPSETEIEELRVKLSNQLSSAKGKIRTSANNAHSDLSLMFNKWLQEELNKLD